MEKDKGEKTDTDSKEPDGKQHLQVKQSVTNSALILDSSW